MKSTSSHRETVLAIVTGFTILYLIFDKPWLVYLAAVVGLAGLLSSFIARWIDWLWGKLTKFIGFINAHLLLGIVFYIILWPIAFLYRLRGNDPLQLKRGKSSYFQTRDHQYSAKDLKNPW